MHAAALFGMSVVSSNPPEAELGAALASWPLARTLWFEQWLRPELALDPHLSGVTLAGPFRENTDALAGFLIERIERGLGDRRRQIASARALASDERLPELAARALVGVAVGMPGPRVAALLDQSNPRFRETLRGTLLPALGARSLPDLQLLLRRFDAASLEERATRRAGWDSDEAWSGARWHRP